MTTRALIAAAILFTATSTAEAERHCTGKLVTQEVLMGTLTTIEQAYCLGRPIRHRIRPDFMQLQAAGATMRVGGR